MAINGNRTSCWMLAAAIAVFASGCRKKSAVVPPPPAPAVVILPKKDPPKKPSTLPPAPKIETPPPGEPPVSVEVKPAPTPPAPVQPKKGGRPAKKDVKTAEAKVEPAPPDATAPPPQPSGPRLGQILPPDQARAHIKRLDAALEHVKNALVIIHGKALNNAQKEEAERIKGFVAQAEEAKDQDLVSAVSLAERADLLARDMLDRLK